MRSPVFKFFASLKLAVISILSLASILAVATILESFYGMRAAHVMIYGTWWFTGVLFLLGLNVLCAALSRYPWKRHQTGFVVTHLGILVLLLGSFLTQRWGVDGNLPVSEKTESNQVFLNDLSLAIIDENGTIKAQIPVPETGVKTEGRILEVALSPHHRLVVDSFLPRMIAENQVVAAPHGNVGTPALKVEVFNDRFQIQEWLFHRHPEKPTELSLGPAILSVQRLWSSDEEKRFLTLEKSKPRNVSSTLGYVLVSRDGREYRVPIEPAMKRWIAAEGANVEIRVDRYLPYAVVEGTQLVSRSKEPVNPAVQLKLRAPGGILEEHTLFARYPEFNTLHEKSRNQAKKKLDVRLVMVSSAAAAENEDVAIVGKKRGQLKFAVSADGRRLLYKVVAASGGTNSSGEVPVGKVVPTGWMDLKFQVSEWFPAAIQQNKPRYVEFIAGAESNFSSALHFKVLGNPTRASATQDDGQWIVEGGTEGITVGGEKFLLQFTKNRLFLPFRVFLNQFTIGTDPGTQKAATYESKVKVNEPGTGNAREALISMNDPLKHGGFTLYQASYQIEEGRAPVSVFSVNYDPGRPVKYAGAIIMTLGILLMFYMNPHYWNKLFGHKG